MKTFKYLVGVRTKLYLKRRRLESRLVNKAFPLFRDWMVRQDFFCNMGKGMRPKVLNYLYGMLTEGNKEELILRQTFLPPVEWNCDKQVAIEARIHGLPVVDPEQPFVTAPAREVRNPKGSKFKVVMKRVPAPKIPKPARRAKRKKAA